SRCRAAIQDLGDSSADRARRAEPFLVRNQRKKFAPDSRRAPVSEAIRFSISSRIAARAGDAASDRAASGGAAGVSDADLGMGPRVLLSRGAHALRSAQRIGGVARA